jgi:hypothetical protein
MLYLVIVFRPEHATLNLSSFHHSLPTCSNTKTENKKSTSKRYQFTSHKMRPYPDPSLTISTHKRYTKLPKQ